MSKGGGAGGSAARAWYLAERRWGELHERMASMSVDSPTGASSDLYRARADEMRALEDQFPVLPGQCGAVLGLEPDLCLDLVSRPDAFARLWPKLRAGYLLDALARLGSEASTAAGVNGFVETVRGALVSRQPSVGLGEDLRLRGQRVIGSGLELDSEVVQLGILER